MHRTRFQKRKSEKSDERDPFFFLFFLKQNQSDKNDEMMRKRLLLSLTPMHRIHLDAVNANAAR
jgi:hypothetical protein